MNVCGIVMIDHEAGAIKQAALLHPHSSSVRVQRHQCVPGELQELGFM
jgi:hypothetical protein